jgi:AraC-like DNA-binding protein
MVQQCAVLEVSLGHIWRNYETRLTLEEVARQATQTEGELRRIFAKHLRCSLHGCVRMVRLAVAMTALRFTDDKIEVIALNVGYRSKKDFYHTIYGHLGLTPSRFRRKTLDAATTQDLRTLSELVLESKAICYSNNPWLLIERTKAVNAYVEILQQYIMAAEESLVPCDGG